MGSPITINWEDVPRGWVDAYNRGYSYGQTISKTVTVAQRNELLDLFRAALALIPRHRRECETFMELAGLHSGLYGVICCAVEALLDGTAHYG